MRRAEAVNLQSARFGLKCATEMPIGRRLGPDAAGTAAGEALGRLLVGFAGRFGGGGGGGGDVARLLDGLLH